MEYSRRNRKLLLVATRPHLHNGAACVAAWTLQALAEEWDVTLMCSVRPNFQQVDENYGTHLSGADITVRPLPFPLGHIHLVDPDPFSIQDLGWLMNFCQKRSPDYDAIVSTDDEFDFGRPGVQYMHFPNMQRHLPALQRVEGMSRAQRFRQMIRGKTRPWQVISGFRLSRMRQNLTVTNSHWTADRIREVYGIEAEVLYPPVRWTLPGTDWTQRRPRFVMLGRISPDKRPLEIIDILGRVRSRGHDIGLDIIGGEDKIAGKSFIRALQNHAAATGDWIKLHVGVSRGDLEQIVSSCRYGIHGMPEEHFGIAVGEQVRAGCIVFVPNGGGQVEIVGREPNLCYSSDDDAVEKISRVLSDPAEQSRLSAVLQERAGLFTEEHFMQGMRELVEDFAARRPPLQ